MGIIGEGIDNICFKCNKEITTTFSVFKDGHLYCANCVNFEDILNNKNSVTNYKTDFFDCINHVTTDRTFEENKIEENNLNKKEEDNMEEDNKIECSCCGDMCDKDELQEMDGDYYCQHCYDEKYTTCYHCGCIVDKSECEDNYVDGDYYCDDCINTLFYRCDDCHNWVSMDNAVTDNYGHCYCESCFQENYVQCEECGMIVDRVDGDWEHLDGIVCCRDCYDDKMSSLGIKDYGYKPTPIFYEEEGEEKDRTKNLHVGIELEIQGSYKSDFCQDISRNYSDDIFYMKNDGSLDDDEGIEIISHPMSFNAIKTYWEKIFDEMIEFDMNDTDNCGLHFHLDKSYFNQDNISVIDFIVNTFDEYFGKKGGRPFGRFCMKNYKTLNQWGNRLDNEDRYHAVNLTNKNTIELRFCDSTADFDTFVERVKLIFAICKFAKNHKYSDINTIGEKQFIEEFEKILSSIK